MSVSLLETFYEQTHNEYTLHITSEDSCIKVLVESAVSKGNIKNFLENLLKRKSAQLTIYGESFYPTDKILLRLNFSSRTFHWKYTFDDKYGDETIIHYRIKEEIGLSESFCAHLAIQLENILTLE